MHRNEEGAVEVAGAEPFRNLVKLDLASSTRDLRVLTRPQARLRCERFGV
jgi:hypothetical protein